MANEMTKLTLRLTQPQMRMFKQAAELGGFRPIDDFVISAARDKAEAIIKKHNNWLASENDRKISFDALFNPPAPNDKLGSLAFMYSKKDLTYLYSLRDQLL